MRVALGQVCVAVSIVLGLVAVQAPGLAAAAAADNPWSTSLGGPGSPAANLGEQLITGPSGARLAKRWQVNDDIGAARAPVVVNGVMYHSADAGNTNDPGALVANSVVTGAQLWSTPLPSGREYYRETAVVGNLILLPFEGLGQAGGVTAVNLATHKVVWSSRAPVLGSARPSGETEGLQADSTRVVLITDNVLCAFATSTGALLWKRDITNDYINAFVMKYGVIYTTDTHFGLTSINAANGAINWTAVGADGSPVVSSGRVIAAYGGGVAAWDADGCGKSVCPPLWTTQIGAEPGDTFLGGVDGSLVYATTTLAATNAGRLVRLSASTGQLQWSVSTTESPSLPVRVADTVWIVNDAQYLVGYSAYATTSTPLRTINENYGFISAQQSLAESDGTIVAAIWPGTYLGFRVAGT